MPIRLPHRNPNNEPPTSRWPTVFSSLSNKNFLYLWLGMMSMMGAVQVEMLAMGYLGYDITASPFLLTVVETGFAIAVYIMILIGIGEATRWALSMTLIMESAEDRFRGRVTSVFMMNFEFMPIAILPAGIAAEHLGGN